MAWHLGGERPLSGRINSASLANAAELVGNDEAILATGKRVVIIGGGDAGANCLGTSHRQKARSIHQFELLAADAMATVADAVAR